jgi:cyanophycin synthetase
MTARLIARLLHLKGSHVGLACSDGLYLCGRQVSTADAANWSHARRILMNRAVEAAVFENGAQTILAEGLAYDRCLVGVVTNIDSRSGLRDFHIDDAEQMAKVIRTQVDLVLPEGAAVLNAADARVAELASLCDGEVVFFAVSPETPALKTHRAAGGRSVFIRNDAIVLARGVEETEVIELAEIAGTGFAGHPEALENILAATGAAWALGIEADQIQAGIEAFDYGGAKLAA